MCSVHMALSSTCRQFDLSDLLALTLLAESRKWSVDVLFSQSRNRELNYQSLQDIIPLKSDKQLRLNFYQKNFFTVDFFKVDFMMGHFVAQYLTYDGRLQAGNKRDHLNITQVSLLPPHDSMKHYLVTRHPFTEEDYTSNVTKCYIKCTIHTSCLVLI